MVNMTRIELLIMTANMADSRSPTTLGTLVNILLEHGIESGMHVGKQKEIPNFFDDEIHVAEWYLGQYLKIIENNEWFAMNSLINQTYAWLDKTQN